jgi:predicted TPR repeat methyltransferase
MAVSKLLFCIVWALLTSKYRCEAQTSAKEFLSKADAFLLEGAFDQAIIHYQKGIQQLTKDDSPVVDLSLRTNLGTALQENGQNEAAIEAYQLALVSYKNNDIVGGAFKHDLDYIAAQAAFYLGMAFQDTLLAHDAVDAYTYAYQLDPFHWSAVANLGSIYHDLLSDHATALNAYKKAFQILTSKEMEPTDPPAEPRLILSQLQYRIGLCINHLDNNTSKCSGDTPTIDCSSSDTRAAHAFSLAIEFDPQNDSAKHMLATVTADATLDRASNSYVKALFDEYAKNFEHSLVEDLQYTGYERLRRGFDRFFDGNPPIFDYVIDAGCGTGLIGAQFRNVSNVLIGIDLSQAIIEQAKATRPNLYNGTVVGDILEEFKARAPISMILAGDSYIYFGDLNPLFEAMQVGLETGGYAVFTLENVSIDSEVKLAESRPDWRWQLTASGRFAHRKEYVEKVGQAHGLEQLYYEHLDGFRYERGVPVRGHIFVMRRIHKDQEL